MRVLIICEDYIYDQYVLQPVIQAMMKRLGKPTAKVAICSNPRLRGVAQATEWNRLQQVFQQHTMIDLFLLCVDRDGIEGRQEALNRLEALSAEMLSSNRLLLAQNAWQEIEVWALAGHDLPANWNWKAIRAEIDAKELYFFPFCQQRQLGDERKIVYKILGGEAAKNYGRIRTRCPEVLELETRIQSWNPA